MADIGKRIRELRLKLGWTVLKLATLAEIDQSYLSRIETGKSNGTIDTWTKIAGALGVSLEAFLPGNSNVEPAEIGWRKIPVLDYVQAGKWAGIDPALVEVEMQETIVTDLENPPSTFALRIKGDSMEPQFHAGDIVVIAPTIEPKPGDYVVATDENGEATFKQYRSAGINEHGHQVFELHPLNPIYAVMRSDRQRIAIVGTMIEHRRYRRR